MRRLILSLAAIISSLSFADSQNNISLSILEQKLQSTSLTDNEKIALFSSILKNYPQESITSKAVSYFDTWLESPKFKSLVFSDPTLVSNIENYLVSQHTSFSSRHLAITYGSLLAKAPERSEQTTKLAESLIKQNTGSGNFWIFIKSLHSNGYDLSAVFDSKSIQNEITNQLKNRYNPQRSKMLSMLELLALEGKPYASHPFFKIQAMSQLLKKSLSQEQKEAQKRRHEAKQTSSEGVFEGSCRLIFTFLKKLQPAVASFVI